MNRRCIRPKPDCIQCFSAWSRLVAGGASCPGRHHLLRSNQTNAPSVPGPLLHRRVGAVADFDPRTPSIARVYDYLLNGKDHFAADREVAERLLAIAPLTAEVTRENRQFLARAVTWAANRGVSQFIDLGCGMPTVPNTHETAQAITTGARVGYVDNDAVVLSHLRALAAQGNPSVTVVDGDVRETDAILSAVAAGIDLSAPACLLMGFLLHFFTPGAARDVATASGRTRASVPIPPGGRGCTTTRWRSSPASSARWNWSRPGW